jgi:hypothetical protein
MAIEKRNGKQNVTIRLDRETVRKAKIIAARSSTSLSELVACRIELIFGEEESYERSALQARELLEHGFHLGGGVRAGRDGLHVRRRRSG